MKISSLITSSFTEVNVIALEVNRQLAQIAAIVGDHEAGDRLISLVSSKAWELSLNSLYSYSELLIVVTNQISSCLMAGLTFDLTVEKVENLENVEDLFSIVQMITSSKEPIP